MALKYFGTDGIRGRVNEKICPELTMRASRAASLYLAEEGDRPFLIGYDPRLSGDMLAAAARAGIQSAGCPTVDVGVLPTPGLAYLVRETEAVGALMISASHNPAAYNGLKFFDEEGGKLSVDQEQAIENLMEGTGDLADPLQVGTGKKRPGLVDRYRKYLTSLGPGLSEMKLALDCAHGATYSVAPRVFRDLGAEVDVLCAEPDGTNINEGCGSTHPEFLGEYVAEEGCDMGFAFDGDGDRVLAVDEGGNLVDGDKVMGICALDMHRRDELTGEALVTTVMSNAGLEVTLKEHGIAMLRTQVGDRNVTDLMNQRGLALGGEQSGHIIFSRDSTTGDGILTALKLLDVVCRRERSLAQLAASIEKFPQVLVNVPVKNKEKWQENELIQRKCREIEESLGDEGRILVRASGTEPVVRVMLEGSDREMIGKLAQEAADVIREQMNP